MFKKIPVHNLLKPFLSILILMVGIGFSHSNLYAQGMGGTNMPVEPPADLNSIDVTNYITPFNDFFAGFGGQWGNDFEGMTVSGIVAKSTTSDIIKYVYANEFNALVGVVRGWFNDGTNLGLNTATQNDVRLNVGGAVQLGDFTTAMEPACSPNLGGALYYNSTDKHFYYYNGTE